MLGDPDALREVCRAYADGLRDLEALSVPGNAADVEAALGERIAALARALGWNSALRFRLRPLDLPRVAAFPKRNHQQAALVRLRGGDAELSLNVNALDVNFVLLPARLPVLLWLLGAVLERDPRISADVACFPGDVCFWSAVNFSGTDPRDCLVPDPTYFETAGFVAFRAAIDRSLPAWEDRRNSVIWRGSTSGVKRYWPPRAPDDVHWLPRLELCARARTPALAEACDVGFTALVQVPPDDEPAIAAALAPLRRPWVPHPEYVRFKATIDIDGNSNTWARGLYCSLLTGACVLKVDSELGFRQWYYDRLEPWVHYVPVKSDLSDLEERVERVLGDDELARNVGRAGRELALSLDFATEMSAAVERLRAWIARGS
jgi:Glycosyl transferase family 90